MLSTSSSLADVYKRQLPYMSIYTSNETHNSILIKYSFDIADYIKSEISAVSFNRFYAEKYRCV